MAVFGSRSSGDALEESDYDILVLSPDFSRLSPPDRIMLVLEARPGSVAPEPVALTPGEFASAEGAPFWDILHGGLVVLDEGSFEAKRDLFLERLEKDELARGEGYRSFP